MVLRGVRGQRIPLPAPAMVLAAKQPEASPGVSKLGDWTSTPFRSELLAPWRLEFEDRHVGTMNFDFESNLLLIIKRYPSLEQAADTCHIEVTRLLGGRHAPRSEERRTFSPVDVQKVVLQS